MLKRKWENEEVLNKINEYKQKYPELFTTPNQSELQALLPKNENSLNQNLPISV